MTKPVVAILIDSSTQREVLDQTTRDALEKNFTALWPAGDGRVTPEVATGLLDGAEGCMTGWGSPALDGKLLAVAPKLKIMAHSAGTVKPFVCDETWKRGIVVTSAAGVIAVDVAHFAVGLMVVGRKNMMEISPQTGVGEWGKEHRHRKSDDLRGSTVGIVAASHVGRCVISLLRHFEVRILLADPFVTAERARELGAEKVELDDLFRESDIVSIHAPSIDSTKHMVDARRLGMMKDGATFINTSRGSLVDEGALVAELNRKRIWAFLDVTDPEPPPKGSPLYGCPNLTLTPHFAGSIGRARKRLGATATEELKRFFGGEKPLYPVTRDIMDRSA